MIGVFALVDEIVVLMEKGKIWLQFQPHSGLA
jgi:hypothetical protein